MRGWVKFFTSIVIACWNPFLVCVLFLAASMLPQSIRRYTLISFRWNWKLCVFRFLRFSSSSSFIHLLLIRFLFICFKRIDLPSLEQFQMSHGRQKRHTIWATVCSSDASLPQQHRCASSIQLTWDRKSEQQIFSNWLNWIRSIFSRCSHRHRTFVRQCENTFGRSHQFSRRSVRLNWIQLNFMLSACACFLRAVSIDKDWQRWTAVGQSQGHTHTHVNDLIQAARFS